MSPTSPLSLSQCLWDTLYYRVVSLPGIMVRFCVTVLLLAALACVLAEEDRNKRSFSGLGCMGAYDKAKFARLDRVCEDCYQLYREAEVHTLCRSNCFKNNFFTQCIGALLLQQDQQQLGSLVDELYGK